MPFSRPLFLFNLLPVCLLAGCATVPAGSLHDNFADYAESVFRHQNALISRLMMLNDNDELADTDLLDKAEERMHDACHWLNEYAERESDGDSMSWRFKAKVQDSIEPCDRRIQELETLLGQYDKP